MGIPSLANPLVNGSNISIITIAANNGRKNTDPAERTKGRARNRPSDKRKIVVENSLLIVMFELRCGVLAKTGPSSPGAR